MLFIDWQQEDAHEFMKELLNSIHEDLNRVQTRSKYKHLAKEL
jgi:ubiquitin C-terminal hydrolase